MRLSIMQPYLFPYVGYFQLIYCTDCFLAYDDVAYIKNGWINRNRWLVARKPTFFTVPVHDGNCLHRIHEVTVVNDRRWRRKMILQFEQSYGKSPYFSDAHSLLVSTINDLEGTIADMAFHSIERTSQYLGLPARLIRSSHANLHTTLSGQARVIAICRQLGATEYINAPGGRSLYSQSEFSEHGINLKFLRPNLQPYPQGQGDFQSALSILDVIAYNGRSTATRMLTEFTLS